MELRISTTTLESFRLMLTEEWMTQERFLEQLKTPFRTSPPMEVGTALHAVIETGKKSNLFTNEINDLCLEVRQDLNGATHEIKETKVYKIGEHNVTIVAKVDAMLGNIIYDHKTTTEMNPTKWQDSIQWKVYLDVFDMPEFCYNVFVFNGVEKKAETAEDYAKSIEDVEYYTVPLKKQENNAEQVLELLEGLLEFIKVHNLYDLFIKKASKY